MPTALEMKPDKWHKFKPAKNFAIRRAQKHSIIDAKEKALIVAKEASSLLKKEFKATRVVIFGSIASEEYFHALSDIDLAAWGIPCDRFYAAVAAVTGLSAVFKIDLVEVDSCRKVIKESILKQGVEI